MKVGETTVIKHLTSQGESGDEESVHVVERDTELLISVCDTVNVDHHDDKGCGAALCVSDESLDIVPCGNLWT